MASIIHFHICNGGSNEPSAILNIISILHKTWALSSSDWINIQLYSIQTLKFGRNKYFIFGSETSCFVPLPPPPCFSDNRGKS